MENSPTDSRTSLCAQFKELVVMQIRRWWMAPLLLGCLSVVASTDIAAQPVEKPSTAVEHKDLDAAIFKTLRTVINQGADLYNSGDWAGCYRLYEGSLITLRPLLDHYPDLQHCIDNALVTAARSPQLNDRAFVLRKAIDEIRKATQPGETAKKEILPPPKPATLWDRLGGEKNVTRVVDHFVNAAIHDPRVNFFRKPTNIPDEKQLAAAKKKFVDFFSSVTGGPYEYKGKTMKEAHKDMGITNAEFDVAEGHLRTALQINGVKQEDIVLLMTIVETTRADIVQPKKDPPPPTTAWQRLGGEEGATKIVDQFVNEAKKDPKVNFYRDPKFVPTSESVIKLKDRIKEQLSTMTGGPLTYKGMDMRVVHRGLGVTNAEYDACLGHLRKALEDHKVVAADLKTIMAKVEDMRKDIVGMRLDPVEPPKDKKPDDKKPDDKKPDDKKPDDKKPGDKKPEDKKPDDKKPEDKKPGEVKPSDLETIKKLPEEKTAVPPVKEKPE
jgi:hemoglobin